MAKSERAPTNGDEAKLPLRAKLGYGTAELGVSAVEMLIQVYLLKFYNVVVGLDEIWTGLALAIAVLWDALSDPIMGAISDRTRSRAGKRRVYFIPGAIALSVSFILIFNPPELDSQLFKFLFLLVTYLMVNTGMTIIAVPHSALGGELSFNRDERTEVYGSRLFFGTVGLLVGTILPGLVLAGLGGKETPENIETSRNLASVYLAVPILVTAVLSYWSTAGRERAHQDVVAGEGGVGAFFVSLWQIILSPVFLPLLLAFAVAGIGRALNASIALYYYEYRLELPESETVFKILLPFFFFIIASILPWVFASKRLGKKWPAFSGIFGLGLMTCIVYPLFPPGDATWPLIAAFIGGMLGGALVLLESLVADIVDYDELKTGQNREGLYFGAWRMSTKVSRAVGILFAVALLSLIGFEREAAEQSAGTLTGLALIFGPGVGLLFIAGALLFALMPLTDRKHMQVQRILRRRRNRNSAMHRT